MPSANEIAGFLSQLFLQSRSMKQPHFLHVDTNSQEKFIEMCLVGRGQKWVWLVWSRGSVIECI